MRLALVGVVTVWPLIGCSEEPHQSFDVVIPPSPIPVVTEDHVMLGYELHLTNFTAEPLTMRSRRAGERSSDGDVLRFESPIIVVNNPAPVVLGPPFHDGRGLQSMQCLGHAVIDEPPTPFSARYVYPGVLRWTGSVLCNDGLLRFSGVVRRLHELERRRAIVSVGLPAQRRRAQAGATMRSKYTLIRGFDTKGQMRIVIDDEVEAVKGPDGRYG